MNPQLPKVEIGPQDEAVADGIEKAFSQAERDPSPQLNDPSELVRAGGSVGVEAGLKDFEAINDDVTLSDDDQTDDAGVSDDGQPTSTAVKNLVGSAVVSQTPAVAEDKDEIEKEWISKAKRIVEQTKSDPYLQERAVSRLQADYMKKRFNKDIKLSEGDT